MAVTSVADKSDRTSSVDGLLSVKEAADLLRMSDKWLYQSDIPFVRMGRRRLYFRASLLEYARQRLSNARSGAK
jgi:excisionase family DNA binding protein